jgi:hypothetical protein
VKERRGPLRRVGAMAGEVAASLRRRQQGREPRVILYDADGHARSLQPGSDGREQIVVAAEQVLEAAQPE